MQPFQTRGVNGVPVNGTFCAAPSEIATSLVLKFWFEPVPFV